MASLTRVTSTIFHPPMSISRENWKPLRSSGSMMNHRRMQLPYLPRVPHVSGMNPWPTKRGGSPCYRRDGLSGPLGDCQWNGSWNPCATFVLLGSWGYWSMKTWSTRIQIWRRGSLYQWVDQQQRPKKWPFGGSFCEIRSVIVQYCSVHLWSIWFCTCLSSSQTLGQKFFIWALNVNTGMCWRERDENRKSLLKLFDKKFGQKTVKQIHWKIDKIISPRYIPSPLTCLRPTCLQPFFHQAATHEVDEVSLRLRDGNWTKLKSLKSGGGEHHMGRRCPLVSWNSWDRKMQKMQSFYPSLHPTCKSC